MRYLGQDEVTQMMGIGSIGEVRRGPDGNLYQREIAHPAMLCIPSHIVQ
jgi:hypothetical protein